MKITVFGLVMILFTQTALSQTKREILEEDPKLSANLRLELTPLNLYSYTDASIQYSARIAYRYKNKFSISGEYRKEFEDSEEGQLTGDPYKSYGKPVQGTAYEVIGTYFFASGEKEANEWLPIKSKSVGYRTVEVTVDPVDMTRLALYGVRLGYGGMKGTNSVEGTLTDVDDGSTTLEEYGLPLQTSTMVFGGLNATRIKNVKVKYPVYGIRRKQVIREYYLDAIYMTSNKYSNIYLDNGTSVTTYRINPSDIRKIGMRIGIFSSNTGRLLNLGYGFEMGILPGQGPFSAAFGYFNVRLVLALFQKVGVGEE